MEDYLQRKQTSIKYVCILKKINKVAFEVIDYRSFLTYIWRGIYSHQFINAKQNE